MMLRGSLLKMRTEAKLINGKIEPIYSLLFNNDCLTFNDLLGKVVRIEYENKINCVKCGAVTKKSYSQGFCYPCFISASETEECVLRPELCRAHEGVARDMEFAKRYCLNDHFVYLAISSGLKVGVTRASKIPTRWIDQGAYQAIKIAQTPNRYTAGIIEVALKDYFADKTNWRNMLTNKIDLSRDLLDEKARIEELLPMDLAEYICDCDDITEIKYPVLAYPEKVKSINLDKTPFIEGVLQGIKGQYLIFDDNRVINIRKHGGYKVSITHH